MDYYMCKREDYNHEDKPNMVVFYDLEPTQPHIFSSMDRCFNSFIETL